jgi:hypothetical protein
MLYIEVPTCILCALESRMQELRMFGVTDINHYVRLSMRISELIPRGRSPLFIESFEEVVKILNNDDPHASEKAELERVASSVLDRVIAYAGNDLTKYFEVAAAANSVDVPMRGYQFNVDDFVNRLLEGATWLGITRDGLRKLLDEVRRVGYVVDNSGEFQIDALLIRKLVNNGIDVTVYARGLPYEVDVTAKYVSEVLGDTRVRIVSTGTRYPVFYNKGLIRDLENHDLIISKGLGNFEAYLERDLNLRALFLFRAKCEPVIKMLKVPRNSPVIYFK